MFKFKYFTIQLRFLDSQNERTEHDKKTSQ